MALQVAASHHIRPLITLRSFKPRSLSDAAEPQCSWTPRHQIRRHRTSAQAAGEVDPEMLREIQRLMPDPGGADNLLAPDNDLYGGGAGRDGWGYGGGGAVADPRMQDAYNDLLTGSDLFSGNAGYDHQPSRMDMDFEERLAVMPPEQRRAELQRIADREAQEEWELQQAQEKAMDLHHAHIDNSNNRYEMTLEVAEIMEELERHDYYTGDDQDRVPSWIRAHFILEQDLEQRRLAEDPALQHAAVDEAALGRAEAGDILPGSGVDLGVDAALADLVGLQPEEAPDFSVHDFGNDALAGEVEAEDEELALEEATGSTSLLSRDEQVDTWSSRQLKKFRPEDEYDDFGGEDPAGLEDPEDVFDPEVLAGLEKAAEQERAAQQKQKEPAPGADAAAQQ